MPEPPIIAPWIINEILKREKEKRQRQDQPQPQLDIPLPPAPPPEERDPDDGNHRGVEYIEPAEDANPDIGKGNTFFFI
jgi:hypothetical protein